MNYSFVTTRDVDLEATLSHHVTVTLPAPPKGYTWRMSSDLDGTSLSMCALFSSEHK